MRRLTGSSEFPCADGFSPAEGWVAHLLDELKVQGQLGTRNSPLADVKEKVVGLLSGLAEHHSLGIVISVGAHLAVLSLLPAEPEGVDRWSDQAVGGEAVLSPGGRGRLRLESAGDELQVSGCLTGIVNGLGADVVIALAEKADGDRSTLVLLPTSDQYVEVKGERLLGLDAATVGSVFVHECHVPTERVLHCEDPQTWFRTLGLLHGAYAGAAVLGQVRAVLEDSYDFALARPLHGASLADLQVVRHLLADLVGRQEMAYAFLRETTAQLGHAEGETASRSEFAQEFAFLHAENCIDRCLQLLGGRGFLSDAWFAQALDDILSLPLLFPAAIGEQRMDQHDTHR